MSKRWLELISARHNVGNVFKKTAIHKMRQKSDVTRWNKDVIAFSRSKDYFEKEVTKTANVSTHTFIQIYKTMT